MNNQSKGKKYLILFTLHYPYHFMDSFIDPEIEKLSKEFDHIYIYSHNKKSDILREIPANAESQRLNKSYGINEKLKLIPLFFSSIWRSERKIIKSTYSLKLGVSIYKTAFSYYASALNIKSTIEQLIQKKNLVDGQIYVYSFFLTEATLAAALCKEKYNLKIVTRLHGYDLYFERECNNYLPFRPYILNQLEQLFFISKNGLNYFQDKLKIPKEMAEQKLSVNYLGTSQNNAPNYHKTDLYPNQLVIVTNSWVLPLKRLDLLANALRILPEDKNITWLHFGDAIGIEKEYCDAFFDNVEALKKSHINIQFVLKGATDRDEILEFYHQNRIDVLVNVSATEGVPITMMEAFSSGVSVVGTNVGGVSEIVSDAINGFLLKPNPTEDEIVEALMKILNQSESERLKFQEAAFKTWEKKFDAIKNSDIFVQKLLEF